MKFKLTSYVTVIYEHTVEASSLEEAIKMVEDGEDDGVEVDSKSPQVIPE